MKIIIVLCLLGATGCFDLWSSVFILSRWMCLCGVSMCLVMLWHDDMALLGRSCRTIRLYSCSFIPYRRTEFVLIVCVCVTVSYVKAILLLHCNSPLSNINNNCSLSHRRLLFLQDLNHPRLKFMAMMFYHLMVVRWVSQLYQIILI